MSDTNNQKYAKSISKFQTTDKLNNSDLFLISQKSKDSYVTFNTTLGNIIEQTKPSALEWVKNEWNMSDINVTQMQNDIKSILVGNGDDSTTSIKSKISFDGYIPEINTSTSKYEDNSIMTKSSVIDLITNSQTFIGSDSYIDSRPNNCSQTGKTAQDVNLITFRIPTNGYDSSMFIDEKTQKVVGPVKCNKTGHLVVYGWLADCGNVLPQEAWVALCGKIKNYGDTQEGTWTILQVQPWNVSNRSHIIQYVGFNIPVNEGLELKIRCGFKVDDTASSTNDFNTLTFSDVQPNTFVGYIIN